MNPKILFNNDCSTKLQLIWITDTSYNDATTIIKNHWSTDITKTGLYIINPNASRCLAIIQYHSNVYGSVILQSYGNNNIIYLITHSPKTYHCCHMHY